MVDPEGGGRGQLGYPPAKPTCMLLNFMTSNGTHNNIEHINGATILPIVVGGVIVIND